MSRRRFFASPDSFASDRSMVTLEQEEARHLRDVLRLRRGEEVFVFDGEGAEFSCIIEELNRDGATLKVESEVEPARPESMLRLTLAVALLKGEKFDLVVQKATELGAYAIKPVITKLSDVKLKDERDGQRRTARLRRIALEAAKQSGRARVPQVDEPISFDTLMKGVSLEVEEWRVMFSERSGRSLIETIGSLKAQPRSICALVGSEGGWADEEIGDAHSFGWSVVTLGGRTLRAETAAIAVATLMQHLFGDLK